MKKSRESLDQVTDEINAATRVSSHFSPRCQLQHCSARRSNYLLPKCLSFLQARNAVSEFRLIRFLLSARPHLPLS